MTTFQEAEEEIRGRINKGLYGGRFTDIKTVYCGWLDYADLLERYGNLDAFPLADKIADGYSYRGMILLCGEKHRKEMEVLSNKEHWDYEERGILPTQDWDWWKELVKINEEQGGGL